MKLNSIQTNIKVPLTQLHISTNVRTDFAEAEIAALAQSIRANGLINPITVKPPVTDENGDKTYEVIAGGRRIRAFQWLCDHGDDFSMIDCKISTGDMWTIQMTENIQRTDLTPREKENAIIAALDKGLSQTQIAEALSKPIQWVSDIVAGSKIRRIADENGLETDEITTKTLSQLRSISEEQLPASLNELIYEGGTYRVATRIKDMYKMHEEAQTLSDSEPSSTTHVSTNFNIGDSVRNPGRRLFSKDVKLNSLILCNYSTESCSDFRVCRVERIVQKLDSTGFVEFDDGDNQPSPLGLPSISFSDIDGFEEHSWLYSLPNSVKDLKDESLISPSEMSEKEFYGSERKSKTAKKTSKKQNGFNWYVKPSDPNAMMSVLGRLPTYLKEMPIHTKICVQAGSKIREISSVIYEPDENRLIFRCLVSNWD